MKYFIYSIKDTKVGQFGQLFLFNNDLVAQRYFKQVASESKIKEDLTLYRIGSFDLDTGDLVCDLQFLANGVDND